MRASKAWVGLCAAVVCVSLISAASANLLTNAGFEQPVDYLQWPNEYGVWGGDKAHSAAAQQGITPLDGRRMLQFDGAGKGDANSASGSQICQAADTSDYQAAIQSGEAVATAWAYFNRIAGDAQTDTQFWVSIFAYAGDVANHRNLKGAGAHLARKDSSLITDCGL